MSRRSDGCIGFEHHRFASVWSALGEDIRRFAAFNPDYRPRMNLRTRISILLQPPLLCLLGYRVAHYLWVRGWQRVGRALATLNLLVHKAHIPADSCIGPGCFLGHTAGTSFIGSAGRDLTLFSLAVCCPLEDATGDALGAGPRLGDRVTLGGHAVVMGNIRVGDDARLAPKSYLNADCPPATDVLSGRLRHTVRGQESGDEGEP